ncbi:MAG: hypothetical protein IIA10_07660 [Proteobacteria bacterium]|nr:hypothetical protein [Pseudomonadota bacterium]
MDPLSPVVELPSDEPPLLPVEPPLLPVEPPLLSDESPLLPDEPPLGAGIPPEDGGVGMPAPPGGVMAWVLHPAVTIAATTASNAGLSQREFEMEV